MKLNEQILELIETQVQAAVMSQSDVVMNSVLNKLKEVIPGQIDDALIEAAKPQILPIVKAELLKLADKINGAD